MAPSKTSINSLDEYLDTLVIAGAQDEHIEVSRVIDRLVKDQPDLALVFTRTYLKNFVANKFGVAQSRREVFGKRALCFVGLRFHMSA